MKWLIYISFILAFLLLSGCMKASHSIQVGTVNQKGEIQLLKSDRKEEVYQKGLDTFNNGRNIKIVPADIENLKTHYIQFKDDNQNLVISNYNVWFDSKRNCIIFTDHVRPYSYYRIEDGDSEFLKNLLLKDEVEE